jgi:hypothetical protein
VRHPVGLKHDVRVLQQVRRVNRPERALAGPEHDGHDIHTHLVDQARGEPLATDVAGGDLDDAVTRRPLSGRGGRAARSRPSVVTLASCLGIDELWGPVRERIDDGDLAGLGDVWGAIIPARSLSRE